MQNKGLIIGGLGLAALFLFTRSSAGSSLTIPPGYSYGGFVNNTGANAIVTGSGQILTALGKLLGTTSAIPGSNAVVTPGTASSSGGAFFTPASDNLQLDSGQTIPGENITAPDQTGDNSQTITIDPGTSYFSTSGRRKHKMGCNCQGFTTMGNGKTQRATIIRHPDWLVMDPFGHPLPTPGYGPSGHIKPNVTYNNRQASGF